MDKHHEKQAKYADVAIENKQVWHMHGVELVPMIISATGLFSKALNALMAQEILYRNPEGSYYKHVKHSHKISFSFLNEQTLFDTFIWER